MRKTLTRLLVVLLVLTSCGKNKSAGPARQSDPAPNINGARELRIATQPAPLYGPIFVVKKKGWLEHELRPLGVAVKWSSFVAGPPENESFFAGNQDVGVLGDTPAIIAKASGLTSRIIGVSATGPRALAVIARDGGKIEKPEQLRAKRVGVTKGSYAHHLLVLVLEKAGLSPKDVQIIHLPPADLVNAFNSGELDAAATWEPYLSRIEGGNAKRIADGTGIKQGALVIIAMETFAKKNPRIIDIFLRAYQRGYEFIQGHSKEASALIASEVKVDAPQLEKLFSVFDYSPKITSAIHRELQATEAFLRSNGLSKGPIDVETFVDETYVRAAGINPQRILEDRYE